MANDFNSLYRRYWNMYQNKPVNFWTVIDEKKTHENFYFLFPNRKWTRSMYIEQRGWSVFFSSESQSRCFIQQKCESFNEELKLKYSSKANISVPQGRVMDWGPGLVDQAVSSILTECLEFLALCQILLSFVNNNKREYFENWCHVYLMVDANWKDEKFKSPSFGRLIASLGKYGIRM